MSDFENRIKIDEKKVNNLIKRILKAESDNIKSGEKQDYQMIDSIRKMIEEEVKCYSKV